MRVLFPLVKTGISPTATTVSGVFATKGKIALCAGGYSWNMNTTYTVIKKCIAKGAIERREPNFLCHALIARDVVQAAETEELLHKLFDSSPDLLFASLLGHQKLSKAQIDNLRRMVAELQAQEENK